MDEARIRPCGGQDDDEGDRTSDGDGRDEEPFVGRIRVVGDCGCDSKNREDSEEEGAQADEANSEGAAGAGVVDEEAGGEREGRLRRDSLGCFQLGGGVEGP